MADAGASRMVARVRQQAEACGRLGSPLYLFLLNRVADDVEAGGPAADVLRGHENDSGPSGLALRLMGGAHRLVLERPGAGARASRTRRWAGPGTPTRRGLPCATCSSIITTSCGPPWRHRRRPTRSAGPRRWSAGCCTCWRRTADRCGWSRSVPARGSTCEPTGSGSSLPTAARWDRRTPRSSCATRGVGDCHRSRTSCRWSSGSAATWRRSTRPRQRAGWV